MRGFTTLCRRARRSEIALVLSQSRKAVRVGKRFRIQTSVFHIAVEDVGAAAGDALRGFGR